MIVGLRREKKKGREDDHFPNTRLRGVLCILNIFFSFPFLLLTKVPPASSCAGETGEHYNITSRLLSPFYVPENIPSASVADM